MSRILCIWELGCNYGHMSTFLPLALRLKNSGHNIIFALKDLSHSQMFLGGYGFSFLQAPTRLPIVATLSSSPPPLNYAEILLRFGFADRVALSRLVHAWRKLYELVQPELIIINHGPTALLSASGIEVPCVIIGNGFFSPPRVSPTPNMRPWLSVPHQRLIDSEQKVLATANDILADLGAPALNTLAGLFNINEDFLCTFPELDHYQNRGDSRYWGPIFPYRLKEGLNPQWPSGNNKKIFAYLSPRHRDFEKILRQLRCLPCRSLIHAPGISEGLIKRYHSVNLKFSILPLNLEQVMHQCDLAICHAGHGTTSAMLLAGVPMLLLPMHLEQYLVARNVASYGAAMLANPEIHDHDYTNMLNRLLSDPVFLERAQSFSNKYADFSQSRQIENIVACCEEIIRHSKNKHGVST